MLKRINAFPNKNVLPFSFIIYLGLVSILSLADAVLSYSIPVVIEKNVNSAFLLGIIMSSSSVVGIIFDYWGTKRFVGKNALFYIKTAVILAIIFPISIILFPQSIISYFWAMAVWGVYYEVSSYSNFHYIKEKLALRSYSKAWSLIDVVTSVIYFAGSIIASLLLVWSLNLPLYFAVFINLIALGFIYYLKSKIFKKEVSQSDENRVVKKMSKINQFKIWRILFGKVWGLWLFMFALVFIDSTFWTIGILFIEELKEKSPAGNLLLIGYLLPGLIFTLLAPRISIKYGKKRTAFISGILAGVFMVMLLFFKHPYMTVILVTISSLFISLSAPLITSTFEDYISRLKDYGDYMIGLEQTAGSLAYILGPVCSGFIVSKFGYVAAFAFSGVFLFSVSIIDLLLIPRKVRMPINEILNS
jgi:MFS family permease